MGKCDKKWIKLSTGVLSRQPEKETEHEAGNYMDDDCQYAEDQGVAADPLVLVWVCLNLILIHLIYNK